MPSDPRFGAPGQTEPPLLDVLASCARTAIDDPAGVGLAPFELGAGEYAKVDPVALRDARVFALNRLDDIIDALNPDVESRETFAATLTMLGRHLAERQDLMRTLLGDAEADDRTAYYFASQMVDRALIGLAKAIDALEDGLEVTDTFVGTGD